MNKPTVTVVIPAFNEEINIKSIIQDVFKQRQSNFALRKVVVYSDNSTDRTHEIVFGLRKRYKVLTLKKDKRRVGKYLRMSQAFTECKTDFLVVLDADIRLVGGRFIEKLIEVLVADPGAVMVSSHHEYVRPETFIGKIIRADFMLWDISRLCMPSLENANSFFGMATAFRGRFARKTRIPEDIYDPHLFLYLSAARVRGFRYAREAVIKQWAVATVADYRKFLKRSLGKRDRRLEKMFKTTAEREYFISRRYKLMGAAKAFLHDPVYTPLGILFNIYMTKIRKPEAADKSAIWDIVSSTKKKFKGK